MKRIKIDLMFERDGEAQEVWDVLKNYLRNKKIRNQVGETSFIDYHECGHLGNKPCVKIERFEK